MFVYFAEVDTSSIVKRVIVLDSKDIIDDEDDTVSEELGVLRCTELYGDISPNTWVRTYKKGTTKGRFATIGGTYDSSNDVFLDPKPYNSWTYDSSIKDWKPPLAKPSVGSGEELEGWIYIWNESSYQSDKSTGWDKVKQPTT